MNENKENHANHQKFNSLAYLKVWDHSKVVDLVFLILTKTNRSSGNLMGTSLVTKQWKQLKTNQEKTCKSLNNHISCLFEGLGPL